MTGTSVRCVDRVFGDSNRPVKNLKNQYVTLSRSLETTMYAKSHKYNANRALLPVIQQQNPEKKQKRARGSRRLPYSTVLQIRTTAVSQICVFYTHNVT